MGNMVDAGEVVEVGNVVDAGEIVVLGKLTTYSNYEIL